MTEFTKKTFKSLNEDGKGGKYLKEHDGYEYTAFAVDGKVFNMFVAKVDDDRWQVIDPRTGLKFVEGATRKEAVEKSVEPKMVNVFANIYRSEKYSKMCDVFIDFATRDGYEVETEPKPEKKPAPKLEKPKAPKPKKQAKPKAPKPKQADELALLLAENEKLKREIEELKSGAAAVESKAAEVFPPELMASISEKLDALIDEKLGSSKPAERKASAKTEKVVEEITLDTMREWCKGKGLTAEQVHPGSDDKIWILGDSKAFKDELLAMGFRWASKSKHFGRGWNRKPSNA